MTNVNYEYRRKAFELTLPTAPVKPTPARCTGSTGVCFSVPAPLRAFTHAVGRFQGRKAGPSAAHRDAGQQ